MKSVHYLQIGLFMLASLAQSAMVALPQYAGAEQAVLHMSVSLMMTLGLIGGSALPSMPQVPGQNPLASLTLPPAAPVVTLKAPAPNQNAGT